MTDLPPLTEGILESDNRDPKKEFEQLMKSLLAIQGRYYGFKFEIDPLLNEASIAGLVRDNYPGIDCPAIFQFIWLKTPINKSPHALQIQESVKQSLQSSTKFKSYVLITPHNLSKDEKAWLKGLSRDFNLKTYSIGHQDIMLLMKDAPALKKYIYGVVEPGAEHFEITFKKYINLVAKELRYLEFIGLPTGQYQRQELLKPTELVKIYIPINFEKVMGGSLNLQLHQVIKQSNRCIILGNPGTGKSTLAKYLALIYSRQIDLGEVDELNVDQKIPFIISIRDFARIQSSKKIESFDFIDYLVYTAEINYRLEGIDRDFFIAMLELGKAVVLFDGLDEVTDRFRKVKIAQKIKEFANQYLYITIWVTSRIFGYTSDVLSYTFAFDHYYLGPVMENQAHKFIEKWYGIQIPLRKNEKENRINLLKKAIRANEGVKRLQKNPLLLTMMTLVHQFEGTLPDDRGKLYEKCVELLLKTWQDQKYITLGVGNPLEDRKIKYHEQLRLLAAVASHIQKKHQNITAEIFRGLIGEQELKEVLFQNRYDPRRIRKEKAEKDVEIFIDYLRDRVGLFVETGKFDKTKENIFAFIHLSFLEYLCAYQLSEDRSKSQMEHISELIDYMKLPSWEEIVLLALYIFSKSPGGNKFIDNFTREAFKMLSKEPIPECWHLLGRAVRDNISFTFDDTRRIIKELVELWVNNPSEKLPIVILKEIIEFSLEGKQFLKEILEENVREEIAPNAFKSLSLYIEWFTVNPAVIKAITNNRDRMNLYPYLPVYKDNEVIARYIEKNFGINHWNIYYNSVKDLPGKNLYSIINYRLNEEELTGYIISSWSKIFAAVQERKHFIEINQADAQDGQQIGKLRLDFDYALVEFPLNIFRHFLDTPAAYLDAPDNIKVSHIKDETFLNQERPVRDETDQLHIMKWIDDLLERHFKELEENLHQGYRLAQEEKNQLKEVRKKFSFEFSQYLDVELISYLNENFNKDLTAFLSHNAGYQDFANYISRDFNLYLGQDYKRDNNFYISKTFSRFLNKEFSQNLSRNFIRYFHDCFTREIWEDFFENYSKRFETQFKELIKSAYLNLIGKPLNWENVNAVNPLDIYNCFLNQFIEHDNLFINHFFRQLYNYLFFNKIKILFRESPSRMNPKPGKQDTANTQWKLIIKKPFFVPFTFDFMLTGVFNHYIIKILAHLNHKFYKSQKPTESMIRETVEEFCRNYPFHYYILREVWPFYSHEFHSKLQPGNPLNNLRLACFITNAAKISMVTDMPCPGDRWESLLKDVETSEDIFVQVSLSLYKMASFENPKKNSPQVYFKMNEFKKKYPQYFKQIGFI